MAQEVLFKKLEQLTHLLEELKKLLTISFEEFVKNLTVVRAAERNFQLLVDTASDINTEVLVLRGKKVPDTYRQSFTELAEQGLLPFELAKALATTAKLRNILVHEYDFEEDYQKFYTSAKECIPLYNEYVQKMHELLKK